MKKGPYKRLGKFLEIEDLAEVLGISFSDLKHNIKTWGDVQGIPKEVLEKKAQEFAKYWKWEPYKTIMALLIFGLVLLPNIEDLVYMAAICMFWAVKVKEEDLVPALLAGVHHIIHMCHENKKGLLLCHIPLLYQWLISHLFKDMFMVETMDGLGWSHRLIALTEESILWYPLGLNRESVT